MAEARPRSPGPLSRAAFVGRDEEWRALDAALDRARRFQAPQVVTLLGALGMGKTRLLDEWLDDVRARGGVRIVRAAVPAEIAMEDEAKPERYALLAALLRSRFQISVGEPGRAMETLRRELQDVFGDRRVAEVAALLGRFLSLEMTESPLFQALATRPEQEVDLSCAVLCRFLERDAARMPLVMALDDVHRADAPSLDLLEKLSSDLGEAALVLVVVARPDLLVRRPAWGHGEGSHVRIEVPALGRRELDGLMRSMLGGTELAAGLVDRAAAESGGNPYLLEQLVRVYLQHGILVAETGKPWWFDAERAGRESMALTPEEAAQVRVGGLTPAERDVLARGVAFGSGFPTGGLIALGRLGVDAPDQMAVFVPDAAVHEVRRVLDDLEERDFLWRIPGGTVPGEVEWAFKHNLERDLVAGGVDPDLMRARKRFAAQWLETRLGAARDDRMEALGTLYEDGGDARRAAYCLLTAGDQARARLRLDRARSLYLRGVRLLELDDAIAKMDAMHKLGDVAARLGRTREALAHFGEMLRLAWRLDLPAKGGAAHGRLGRLHRALGDYKRALAHLELARRLFELGGDKPGIASVLDDMGRVKLLTGNPDASMECHRAALAVREEVGDDRAKALTLAFMGEVQHQSGDLVAAEEHLRRALDLRRRTGDRQGVVSSLLGLGAVARDRGNADHAVAILEESRTLARELGERLYECYAGIEVGDCRLAAGRPRDALGEFRHAKEIARQFGAKRLVADALRGGAEAHLALGDALKARDDARAALDIADAIGAPGVAGACLRVLATALGLGAPGDAEVGGAREAFDRALRVLGDAGAEIELGHALVAYADFEERTGREDAAAALRADAEVIRTNARGIGKARQRHRDLESAALD